MKREPHWKLIHKEAQQSKEKSVKSRRSSRYHPRRSPSPSEKQFSLNALHHSQSQNISDLVGSRITANPEPVNYAAVKSTIKGEGSQIIRKKKQYERKESAGGSSLDHGASSIYPRVNDHGKAKPVHSKTPQSMIRQPTGGSGSMDSAKKFWKKIETGKDLEHNFPVVLETLEFLETQMELHRTEIERQLNQYQQKFNKNKKIFLQSYLPQSDHFQDKNLKKLLYKQLKIEDTSESNLKKLNSEGNLQQLNGQRFAGQGFRGHEGHNHSPRNRSNSAYKQNFERVLGALEGLKKRLDDCRNIRHEEKQSA